MHAGLHRRPRQHSALEAIFAAWGYAVQIYCDFSGYTDIAIGLALLLGFRFPQNFDAPYTARNLQDFWRRWHMTLSRWLRDYLYIPLGGNAAAEATTVRNIMITMVLGGLWHGAAWTFVIWGALHGVGPERRAPAPDQPRAPRAAAGGRRPGAGLGAALPDLPVRVPGLGLLQRHRACRRPWPCSAACSAAGASRRRWSRPLLVAHRRWAPSLSQFVPPLSVSRLQAAFSRQHAARAGRDPRLRPARHHHLRPRGRRPLHLLPVLMDTTPARPPPPRRLRPRRRSSVASRSLPSGVDAAHATGACGCPGPASCCSACWPSRVWFLLFAPTLQHNAQVSPVGTRRTISLDITGPVRRAEPRRCSSRASCRRPGARERPAGRHGRGSSSRGRTPASRSRRRRRTPSTVPGQSAAHDDHDGRRPTPSSRPPPTPLRVLIVGDSIGLDMGGRAAVRPGGDRRGQRSARRP